MSEVFPIETAPKDGFFLAQKGNDWLRVKRFDSPFGHTDAVINTETGRWWQANHWMPEPTSANSPPKENSDGSN